MSKSKVYTQKAIKEIKPVGNHTLKSAEWEESSDENDGSAKNIKVRFTPPVKLKIK